MAERVTRRRMLGTLGVLGAAVEVGVVPVGAPPPAAVQDRPLQGRPAFRAYLERTFTAFPDLRIEVTSCDAGSALTVSESIMRGTHLGKLGGLPATRRRITTRVACVFEVRDGKIAHERLYWDRANTLRQLGRVPALMAAALQPPVPEAALVRRVEQDGS